VTYTAAALLGLAGTAVLDLVVLRTRLVLRAVFWATYPVVIGFQLLFNGLLTGWGVVRYNPDDITGLRLFNAPVEDLVFGFALVLMTLSLWVWWERRCAVREAVTGNDGSPPARGR
jgi:lycopene cyclase domain-containing protein